VQIWVKTGDRYEGDWVEGNRHGFGMYSKLNEEGELVKEYSGGWKNDKKHGYGTNFYSLDEYYEGEWYGGERSGWGRMYFADGSVYEGEWFEDKRNGKGLLKMNCGNRYEGSWKNNMKHGEGKFLYLDKGQVYSGLWYNDIAKCGTLEDYGRDIATNKPIYPIPECKLKEPKHVLENARTFIKSLDV
jgi:hypothetical protein